MPDISAANLLPSGLGLDFLLQSRLMRSCFERCNTSENKYKNMRRAATTGIGLPLPKFRAVRSIYLKEQKQFICSPRRKQLQTAVWLANVQFESQSAIRKETSCKTSKTLRALGRPQMAIQVLLRHFPVIIIQYIFLSATES